MKVTALMTDGFETVEALAVVDILRRANVEIQMVSITGSLEVLSAQNIVAKAEALLEDVSLEESDVLFLPGGAGHKSFLENKQVLDALVAHDKAGKRIAAICAAPSVLGRLGLLEGKQAVCFPGFEQYLTGATVLEAPVRVVTDGNITTSRGMGTSIDLGLELVKLLVGEEEANTLAKTIQFTF